MYNYKKKQVLKHNQIKNRLMSFKKNNAILTALYYSLFVTNMLIFPILSICEYE